MTTPTVSADLRSCKPCNAIHIYENPFRMAALQGGLELEEQAERLAAHRGVTLAGITDG